MTHLPHNLKPEVHGFLKEQWWLEKRYLGRTISFKKWLLTKRAEILKKEMEEICERKN